MKEYLAGAGAGRDMTISIAQYWLGSKTSRQYLWCVRCGKISGGGGAGAGTIAVEARPFYTLFGSSAVAIVINVVQSPRVEETQLKRQVRRGRAIHKL